MMMSSGLNFGVRASLPHLFGICFGFPTMFLAVGFGLGYFFEQYPMLHTGIKIVGILYLLYLAYLIAVSAQLSEKSVDEVKAPAPLTFMQAALFQWVNPKAWIMGTSAIAAYTTVGADMQWQIISIGVLFMAIAFPGAGVWLVFGVGLQRLINKPAYLRAFNIVMAFLLVASIWPIVAEMLGEISAS